MVNEKQIEKAIKKSDRLLEMFKTLFENGETPNSKNSQMLARTLILHIEENFYECNEDTLQTLIENYLSDSEQIKILNKKSDKLNVYVAEVLKIYKENNY